MSTGHKEQPQPALSREEVIQLLDPIAKQNYTTVRREVEHRSLGQWLLSGYQTDRFTGILYDTSFWTPNDVIPDFINILSDDEKRAAQEQLVEVIHDYPIDGPGAVVDDLAFLAYYTNTSEAIPHLADQIGRSTSDEDGRRGQVLTVLSYFEAPEAAEALHELYDMQHLHPVYGPYFLYAMSRIDPENYPRYVVDFLKHEDHFDEIREGYSEDVLDVFQSGMDPAILTAHIHELPAEIALRLKKLQEEATE